MVIKELLLLEQIEHEKYCIIVPKISIDGDNWNYFIRCKETPELSFVTCRYNNQVMVTVEQAAFFHRGTPPEIKRFISTVIDPTIRKILYNVHNS